MSKKNAPPRPDGVPMRKSVSLDAILSNNSRPYSPEMKYGLDLNYRTDPRYNPKSHFNPISKGGRASPLSPASSPRSPRPLRIWSSSPLLSGVSMRKSPSLPHTAVSDDESGPPQRPCPAPQSGGVCKFARNAASEMACVFCGAVDKSGVAKVSLERISNCPKEKEFDAAPAKSERPCSRGGKAEETDIDKRDHSREMRATLDHVRKHTEHGGV